MIVSNTSHPARVAAALLTVFFITTEVGAAPGDLDPKLGGFGAAGILGNPGFRVEAMAFDQQGRLVLAGTENDQFHVRRRSGNRFQIVEDVPIIFQEVESQANGMAIDSEGRIVVVGYVFRGDAEFEFGVARLKPDLSLDETFGNGGLLAFEVDGTFNVANAVAIQSDNKIVVVGRMEASSGSSASDWAIVRLNEDGSFDNSFDGNGKKRFNYNSDGDEATAVAFQGDKILVAGGRDDDFGLARLNSNGSLDGTFGSAGDTQVGFGALDGAEAMAIAPDGKIVLAGFSFDGTAVMAVARFSFNGFPDNTFGGNGKVTASIGSSSSARAVDVQGDGKVVVVGSALLRYNDNGALDPAFGDGGIVAHQFFLNAIVAQSDGNIVVGGFDVARYRWDGSLDTGGIAHLTFDPDHVGSEVTALAVGDNGKLVAVGKVFADDYDAAMARFHADLVLDTTFGNETPKRGMTLFGSAGLSEELQSAAVEGDGDVIAAGQVNSQNAGDNFLVARVKSDGMPDGACSADAFGSADFSGANDRATAVAVGPSATIYAAGNSVAAGTGEDYALMRFTASCTLDSFGSMRGDPYAKRIHLGGDEGAVAMVNQAVTGRPVLAGSAGGNIVLIRLRVVTLSPGVSPGLELDPSFGVGGTAVLDTGGSEVAAGLAQLADGTLLVAGTVTNGPVADFLVARFTASGQLDNSFGVGGVGLASFHAVDTARSLDVRGDGTIAVAGITNAPDGIQFALAQFLPNGFLDPGFAGLSGKTTLRLGELGEDVAQAVQFVGNNRVVVGGYSTVFGVRQFSLAAFTTTAETPTTTTTTTSTLPDSACGDPVGTSGSGPDITASDALFILRAAVGSESCDLCVCDVNGSGSISATDALVALRVAVGQNVPLMCPAC